LGLSKHAKILHKLLRWTGPHAGAWLCDVAELNPSLGLKRRHVYPALDELAENRLVKIKVESLRDPKHPKRLIKGRALKDLPYLKIEHLEETPISIKNLEAQILRLLLSCRSIEDNEFAEGWKHKYYSWDADQKIFQLTHHFIEINQCFYLLNLVNAIKGLRTVRTSDRKELLRYYHLAFKLMKKDQDYKIVWPTMRQRLLQFLTVLGPVLLHTGIQKQEHSE